MRVALVSIFPPNTNGVGDYTHDLYRALKQQSPDTSLTVLADRAGEQDLSGVEVDRCWSVDGNWVPDLVAAADRMRPDVVHLQHASYMGRDERVPALLEELDRRGIRSVITLHGQAASNGRWRPRRFHRALQATCDRIVIHQRAGSWDQLVADGVEQRKLAVIPHGTPSASTSDRAASRARLGLPADRRIALFLGFIMYSKGVDTVARAFRRVVAAVPDAHLVIAGRPEPFFEDQLYRMYLELCARRGRREGWIDYRPRYLAAEDIPEYLAAADVVVFPYRQNWGFASGILHRSFAAGRAVLCSRTPKFVDIAAELGEEPSLVLPQGIRGWASSLVRVLQDTTVRERLERATTRIGERTAWPVVADHHLALYRELAS
jgi:glycosyltransferase involved in cell wall biosynthesis